MIELLFRQACPQLIAYQELLPWITIFCYLLQLDFSKGIAREFSPVDDKWCIGASSCSDE